jgi:hypothetical protein
LRSVQWRWKGRERGDAGGLVLDEQAPPVVSSNRSTRSIDCTMASGSEFKRGMRREERFSAK